MSLLPLLKSFTDDPVQLNIKAKILSLPVCFCAIFFIAIITQAFIGVCGSRIIVASMGASAIILFGWNEEKTRIECAGKVRSYNRLMVHVFGKLAAAMFFGFTCVLSSQFTFK